MQISSSQSQLTITMECFSLSFEVEVTDVRCLNVTWKVGCQKISAFLLEQHNTGDKNKTRSDKTSLSECYITADIKNYYFQWSSVVSPGDI